jgi:hypothetical protein
MFGHLLIFVIRRQETRRKKGRSVFLWNLVFFSLSVIFRVCNSGNGKRGSWVTRLDILILRYREECYLKKYEEGGYAVTSRVDACGDQDSK